ncbi:hypothetical protein [Hymenobacter terricola]|uniref:hypothetical protein n=1 Tax=Hymenobacter terricola TaxID=2819236 RepID=UPI001B303900|nr:hypothetical protein [Hymenobacter terricola]
MPTHRYEYATVCHQGVEVGVVRCPAPERLANHLDLLALRHRPQGGAVLLSTEGGTLCFLDEDMANLFPRRSYDAQGLAWRPFALTIGASPA